MAKNEISKEKSNKGTRKRKNRELTCWEKCKLCLDPLVTDDSVHICLGGVIVTRCELDRMIGSKDSKEE